MSYKNNPLVNEPTTSTDAASWIQWHKDLKSTFGKKTANSLFLAFWNKRKSSSANTHDLRAYAEKQGFKIEGDSISGIVDAVYDVGDAIGDVFKIGKYATIAVCVILIGGLGMLIFSIAKQPIKAIGAVTGRGGAQ